MRSSKGYKIKNWTSTPESRANHDRIFGKKKETVTCDLCKAEITKDNAVRIYDAIACLDRCADGKDLVV